MKILIADDEPVLLSMLEECFQSRGNEVSTAVNGEQAWHLFREAPESFGAILIDYRMPIMNGLDCIKRIRENGFTLPVVLMSGDFETSKKEVIGKGAFVLLSKPVRLATFDAVFSRLESYVRTL